MCQRLPLLQDSQGSGGIQMRELKVIDVDKMADVRSLRGQFYRRSAVDKVIEYLQNQISLARTGLIKLLAKAQHEAHHNKYKRCLAMAERCKYRMYYLAAVVEQEESKIIPLKAQIQWYEKRERRMYYWKNRWLAIAEKFKEAK